MPYVTQRDLVLEFYKLRPDRDIPHAEAVDWLVCEYHELTGKVFRDPDRAIRKLHQEGVLIKINKGVYKYDPSDTQPRELEDFTSTQKQQILERDRYRCVVCGLGKENGVEIQVDHIKPKELGGRAEVNNGQVLCGTHNYRKKTYQQTESGKRMFMLLHDKARQSGDCELMDFCTDILGVYDKHNINGHIGWDKDSD